MRICTKNMLESIFFAQLLVPQASPIALITKQIGSCFAIPPTRGACKMGSSMEIYIIRHGETRWNKERKLQGRADIPLDENGIALAQKTGVGMRDIPFDLCFSSPLLRARQTAQEILKENAGYRERAEAFLKENPDYREIVCCEDNDDHKENAGCKEKDNHKGNVSYKEKDNHKDNVSYKEKDVCKENTERAAAAELLPVCTDERIIEINFGPWEGLGCGPDNYELPVKDFREFFVRPDEFVMPQGAETVQSVEKRAEDFLKDLFGRKELQDKTILVTTHGCAMSSLLLPFYRAQDPAGRPPIPHNCQVARIVAKPGEKPVLADKGRIYYE